MYPADPDILGTDPPENLIKFGKWEIYENASDNKIPEIGRQTIKTILQNKNTFLQFEVFFS